MVLSHAWYLYSKYTDHVSAIYKGSLAELVAKGRAFFYTLSNISISVGNTSPFTVLSSKPSETLWSNLFHLSVSTREAVKHYWISDFVYMVNQASTAVQKVFLISQNSLTGLLNILFKIHILKEKEPVTEPRYFS